MSLFFTKRKFLSYSSASQHKKASELVKNLYLSLLYKKNLPNDLLQNYKTICDWMRIEWVSPTLEALSSRFHFHLDKTNYSVQEHLYLPKVSQLDKPKASDFLNIDIYLDNIRSSFNIGSIMRTTEALRLGNLIFSKEMASPNHKKVLDTSMGADKFLTPRVVQNFIPEKRPIIVLETTENAASLYDFSFPESFTLIFGNEEYGVSSKYLQTADHVVQIPLYGIKNSLNVATAFSIVAYEIRRQLF